VVWLWAACAPGEAASTAPAVPLLMTSAVTAVAIRGRACRVRMSGSPFSVVSGRSGLVMPDCATEGFAGQRASYPLCTHHLHWVDVPTSRRGIGACGSTSRDDWATARRPATRSTAFGVAGYARIARRITGQRRRDQAVILSRFGRSPSHEGVFAWEACLLREVLGGDKSPWQPSCTDWVAAMITPTTVAVVLVGSLSCLVDGVNRVLLAWISHLPPSAVPLVSDYRFRRSAQRLARLT
jgi:hypothetical protein